MVFEKGADGKMVGGRNKFVGMGKKSWVESIFLLTDYLTLQLFLFESDGAV